VQKTSKGSLVYSYLYHDNEMQNSIRILIDIQ